MSILKFIHLGHFFWEHFFSSPQLLRSDSDTARILPKVPTWRPERNSNQRPSDQKVSTLPMRHHVQQMLLLNNGLPIVPMFAIYVCKLTIWQLRFHVFQWS